MIACYKKRQFLLALFLCLHFYPVYALCLAEGTLLKATVKKVVDGDTFILTRDDFKKDRRVRFVGVNTPELDHKDGMHDAFALEAFQFLLPYEKQTIYYQIGKDNTDRYGRYLYYLFDSDRISIGSRLLSEGLGYRVAIPPNLRYQSCFMEMEAEAKAKGLGIWHEEQHWLPKAGFAIADVIITSVTQRNGGWWLKTNRNLAISLPQYFRDQWTEQDVYRLEGRRVIARGWQFSRKYKETKTWVMLIKHPNDLMPELL